MIIRALDLEHLMKRYITLKSNWLLILLTMSLLNLYEGHENEGNDHKLTKLLIFKPILLVSSMGNVKRTVRRIGLLM